MTSPAHEQTDAIARGQDETPLENPDEDLFEPDWERPRRTNRFTAVLAAGLVAAAGFAGGVTVQRNHDTGLTAAVRAESGPRNPVAGDGNGGSGGAAADVPVVVGTIESISGTTVQVTNVAGTVITVTVPPTATVTTTGLDGLTVGTPVSVVGTKTADATVTATTLTSRKTTG